MVCRGSDALAQSSYRNQNTWLSPPHFSQDRHREFRRVGPKLIGRGPRAFFDLAVVVGHRGARCRSNVQASSLADARPVGKHFEGSLIGLAETALAGLVRH